MKSLKYVMALAVSASLLPLSMAEADLSITQAEAEALVQTMPRSGHSADSTYFVLTDRYADGDPTNNNGGGQSEGGYFPPDERSYHGGDFVGLTANMERIAALGFTSLWVTPPVLNQAIQGSTAAYHGYWGLDFTTVDPHLGTEAEFAAMVEKAHSLGIKVIMDIVMNHTADVIYNSSGDYSFVTLKEAPYKFGGKVVNIGALAGKPLCTKTITKNCFPDFTAKAFPHRPTVEDARVTKAPAFLNDITLYHNRGDANDCGWMEGQCAQMGDFFGLDDIMTEDPRVVQGWAETWAEWVVKYDLDGFRIDTAKHTNDKFFPQWWSKIRGDLEAAGKTDFTIYGEAWYNAVADLATYAQKAQLQSYLDFPMQTAISNYVRYSNGATLHNVVRLDDMYNLSGFNDGVVRNAYNLTTFLGNHDMGRGNSMLGADPTEPDAVDRVNLANSILFLFRGSPVVYYGDEVGMISYGGDADARQDMMPTEVPLWQEQERIGAAPLGTNSALGLDELQNPVAQHIIKLQQLRKQHPALANGAVWLRDVKERMASWSKFDAVARREYVVVTNSSEEPGEITVQTSTPGATFSSIMGQSSTLTADSAGKLVVPMAGRSTLVLRADSPLPATSAAPSLRIKAKKEAESGIPMVFASAYTGLDPISVTFVARKDANSPWFVLGTDDNASFRLPLNAKAWGGSKSLQIAAIAKTSDGKVTAGPVNTIVRANIK